MDQIRRACCNGSLRALHLIGLAKGHQPAGTKAGVQGQAQGLSQEAKDALARVLGMPAAPQA